MIKKRLYILLPVVLLVVSGCATATTKKVNALENKAAAIEEKLSTLEQRQAAVENQSGESRESVGYVKGKLEGIPHGPSTVVVTGNEGYLYKSDASALTPKDIQLALKDAGFYNGAIDGEIGKNTKKAIKDFQKANGLQVDGTVGPKTKELLLRYLKQGAR
ncbi:MAG: peptidoglycan-binding domain-containing protein [Candidatus Omnitrophica bacterium]|nr:peptidoglycan-binding domain-containing protein [Candidatus Omnitrophota bacterium]